MALHCMSCCPEMIDGIIGVAGYLFKITPFNKSLTIPFKIIYGKADITRPWEYVRHAYEGIIPQEKIILVEGMKHEVNEDTKVEIRKFLTEIMSDMKPKI